MEKAVFSLVNFSFVDAELHLANATQSLNINIKPTGILILEDNVYELTLFFTALNDSEENKDLAVSVCCKALFKFSDKLTSIEEIPDFFYANSIAIVFPYLRAFVSNISLQANVRPMILPTMNLSSLGTGLKENSSIR